MQSDTASYPHVTTQINKHFVLSIVLVGIGYLIYSGINVPYIFYVGCLYTTIVCGWHAIFSIFKDDVSLGAILSSQSVLWYALPFTYIGFFEYDKYAIDASQIENATSSFIVALCAAGPFLWFQGFGKRVRVGNEVNISSFLYITLSIAAMQTVLIALGDRGYTSVVGVYQERESSIFYQLIVGMSPAIMPMCAAAIAWVRRQGHYHNASLIIFANIAIIFVQMLWWTTAGRRHMTIVMLLSLIAYFSILYKRKVSEQRIYVLIAATMVSAPLVWYLWESYYILRIATDVTQGSENLSILDIERARSLAAGSNFSKEFINNAIERPFLTLSSFSIIRDTSNGILWGWNFISQTLLTIPSFLFSEKFEFIGPVLENLWTQRLGTPLNDWTNTLFLESYIDYGIFGFPVYVVVLHFLGNIVFNLAAKLKSNAVLAFAFLSLSFAFLNTETTVNDMLVIIRSTVAIIAIAWIIQGLSGNRNVARTR